MFAETPPRRRTRGRPAPLHRARGVCAIMGEHNFAPAAPSFIKRLPLAGARIDISPPRPGARAPPHRAASCEHAAPFALATQRRQGVATIEAGRCGCSPAQRGAGPSRHRRAPKAQRPAWAVMHDASCARQADPRQTDERRARQGHARRRRFGHRSPGDEPAPPRHPAAATPPMARRWPIGGHPACGAAANQGQAPFSQHAADLAKRAPSSERRRPFAATLSAAAVSRPPPAQNSRARPLGRPPIGAIIIARTHGARKAPPCHERPTQGGIDTPLLRICAPSSARPAANPQRMHKRQNAGGGAAGRASGPRPMRRASVAPDGEAAPWTSMRAAEGAAPPGQAALQPDQSYPLTAARAPTDPRPRPRAPSVCERPRYRPWTSIAMTSGGALAVGTAQRRNPAARRLLAA
jgi:hypothetical protein